MQVTDKLKCDLVCDCSDNSYNAISMHLYITYSNLHVCCSTIIALIKQFHSGQLDVQETEEAECYTCTCIQDNRLIGTTD